MRKPVIAGNWKLFKTQEETTSFLNELKPLVSTNVAVDIVVAPVFTALTSAASAASGSLIPRNRYLNRKKPLRNMQIPIPRL